MRLEKVTALVTGASSGIGQAVSSHFRREGARLLLTGRRARMDTAQADDLYVQGDLNDEAFVAALAEHAADTFGSVDVVVLNHGLQASGPLTEMAYAAFEGHCGIAKPGHVYAVQRAIEATYAAPLGWKERMCRPPG